MIRLKPLYPLVLLCLSLLLPLAGCDLAEPPPPPAPEAPPAPPTEDREPIFSEGFESGDTGNWDLQVVEEDEPEDEENEPADGEAEAEPTEEDP